MLPKRMSLRTEAESGTATSEKTDAEVHAILTEALADTGATPAAVYAFHKTGIYLTAEFESQLSPAQLRAWEGAVEEYEALANRPNIFV